MFTIKSKNKGIIALTTLILITAILLFSGITLLLTSIDLSSSTEGFANNALAKIYTTSCLEEAMQRLNKSTGYTGTVNITFPDGSCSAITATTGNPSQKSISVTTLSEEFTSSDAFIVDISVDPITIIN